MEQISHNSLHPQELAQMYDAQIKQALSEKFAVEPSQILVLSEDEHGAYFSTEEANTWCCFAVGTQNGYLYLVTAKLVKDTNELRNFTSTIIS